MNNTTDKETFQQSKSSLHPTSGSVDLYTYRAVADFSNSREYLRDTSKQSKNMLDGPTLRKMGLERLDSGRIAPLGNNASNVDTCSWVPYFSDGINIIKEREYRPDYKPVRKQNHKIKHAISENRLAYERVHNCGCKTIGHDAEMFVDSRHGNARVSSVETCGSVWACPVCGSKILQQRSEDLKSIGKEWQKRGGNIYMLTLTFSHNREDILSDLLGKSVDNTGLMGAIRKFRQSRVWRDFKTAFSYEADCRAVEITWGNKSGFHPHVHMLIYGYYDSPEYLTNYWESRLFKCWANQCQKVGLGAPNRKNGIDLRRAKTTDYIAKWGASSELTSGHAKQAKGNNYSIRQLQEFLIDDVTRSIAGISLQKVKALLSVYNNTMKGHKLLTWAGTKKGEDSFKVKMIGGKDLTDEEIAEIQEEELQYLSKVLEIDSSSWQTIYWRGHSATIRDILEIHGAEGVIKWGEDFGYDVSTWSLCEEDKSGKAQVLDKKVKLLNGKFEPKKSEKVPLSAVIDYDRPCPF